MSSPTPDHFTLKAEQARNRALRSRTLMKVASVAGVTLAFVFVAESLYYKPQPPREVAASVPKALIISGGASQYSGIDKYTHPFSVQAQHGVQDAQEESLMHLETVVGSFIRRGGGAVEVVADRADYDTKTKDLNLTGKVRFVEHGRYTADLQTAKVNLEQQAIATNQPVQVKTGDATVLADTMETSDDGTVYLRGHVKAHFESGFGN